MRQSVEARSSPSSAVDRLAMGFGKMQVGSSGVKDGYGLAQR